jgi:RNA polymerase sigma-70 factor (ECF subfamily)
VEEATDELPDDFRLVFIARAIEGMSVEETAELLNIKPGTVRTRLHRARELLRKYIDNRIGPVFLDAFPFAGWRCERLTTKVMKRLGIEE